MNYREIKDKAYLILDLTSLTPEEFEELLPHFEQAFLYHMSHWRMDGKPRTSRGFSTYKNSPLPTPEDRLLFILSYLKTNPIQSYHGAAFGMPQAKVSIWVNLLLHVLRETFRHLGDTPARWMPELVQQLEETTTPLPQEADGKHPLFSFKTAWNDRVNAPKTILNKKHVIAARKNAILTKT